FSRRTFVKGTGALIVAIGAPRLLNPKAALAAVNGDFPIGPAAVDPNLIDSWIAIGTDNTVTMKVGKVELGQGTVTAAMQLVADELDVPLAGVKFVQSDTWVTPDQGTTAGSQSTGTQNGPAGIRQAAAEARLALLHAAVVRPPTRDSTLVKVDGFPGGKQPADVVQVVQKNNYVAVVAKTEWGAILGAAELKVTWNVKPYPNWSTYNDDLVTLGPSTNQVIQDSKLSNGQDVDAVIAATPAANQV